WSVTGVQTCALPICLAGYQFGLADEEVETARQPLEAMPETDPTGKASFTVTLDKQPVTTRPLEAQVIVRMAETGGRAVERKLTPQRKRGVEGKTAGA